VCYFVTMIAGHAAAAVERHTVLDALARAT
jgi:hypothetical protein